MEVSIPAKLHNSLIGTKGRLVRSIMEECGGVHIHFPVEGSGSDTVVIRGPSSDVEKARKQLLHLAEEKVSPPTPEGPLPACCLLEMSSLPRGDSKTPFTTAGQRSERGVHLPGPLTWPLWTGLSRSDPHVCKGELCRG